MKPPFNSDVFLSRIDVAYNASSGLWDAKIADGDLCHAMYSAQTPEEAVKGVRNQLRISHHKLATLPPKGEIQS